MFIVKNKRNPSGMYSKAGRISYERHHVFQRSKQILNPEEQRKKVIPYVSVVDQLEEKFGGKLSVALNKKNSIEQQLKLLEMYEKEKKNEERSERRKKKLEPFELMRTREIFKPDKVKKEPEVGTYNPKYSSVFERVKSVPKFDIKHSQSRLRDSKVDEFSHDMNLENSRDQLDSLISNYDYEINNNSSIVHDKSQIYKKTKGSYNFKKMSGRTRHGFLEFQPNPHESRFEKRKDEKLKVKGENIVKFDKYTSRYKKNVNKADFSTPYYNPSYKLIKKRSEMGTVDFGKSSPRKDDEKEVYCKNDYDIVKIEKGMLQSESTPNFSKMTGRYDNSHKFLGVQ